jgi:NitT/TauT family transport system substrate-binding protein
MIPDQGPATALRALASVDPAMANAKIDLKSVYTNDFVKKANAKYPKG